MNPDLQWYIDEIDSGKGIDSSDVRELVGEIKRLRAEVEEQKRRKASIGKGLDKWRNRAVAHQDENKRLRTEVEILRRESEEMKTYGGTSERAVPFAPEGR